MVAIAVPNGTSFTSAEHYSGTVLMSVRYLLLRQRSALLLLQRSLSLSRHQSRLADTYMLSSAFMSCSRTQRHSRKHLHELRAVQTCPPFRNIKLSPAHDLGAAISVQIHFYYLLHMHNVRARRTSLLLWGLVLANRTLECVNRRRSPVQSATVGNEDWN